jgi:hypothetical protein
LSAAQGKQPIDLGQPWQEAVNNAAYSNANSPERIDFCPLVMSSGAARRRLSCLAREALPGFLKLQRMRLVFRVVKRHEFAGRQRQRSGGLSAWFAAGSAALQ